MKALEQIVPKDPSVPKLSGSDTHTSSGGFDLPELWGISHPGVSRSVHLYCHQHTQYQGPALLILTQARPSQP